MNLLNLMNDFLHNILIRLFAYHPGLSLKTVLKLLKQIFENPKEEVISLRNDS